MSSTATSGAEQQRIHDADTGGVAWRRWGPYLSDRQWGTVREDASADGDAWNFFTHDQARSRAYRWGEDGIAGFSDDRQRLCLAVALWNGADPILKERFFGLTNAEGNHGEDAKEYWFHLDGTPTHSYLRMVYKYPQRAFPYTDLVATNAARGRTEFEYELLDTGVFADGRYFDVEIEYAKAAPEDVLLRITVHNRGPEPADLRLLPTLWFRNTWSWGDPPAERPVLREVDGTPGTSVAEAVHPDLGRRWLVCLDAPGLRFTGNDTNTERLFGTPNASPYVKDGIDRYVVHGDETAVNPDRAGTKAAADYPLRVPAGGSATVRVRLTDEPVTAGGDRAAAEAFDAVVARRRAEADEFYEQRIPAALHGPVRQVVRQALAGMLWSKQYFGYDVEQWLIEHGLDPLDARGNRNGDWFHMECHDVISMPDTWEYPWFAAWDLAFQAVTLAMVDTTFAKGQLDLLLSRRYLHPNGQIPAYEWNFSDVNPPVHAWAAHLVYELEKARTGRGDRAWLESVFHKLARNFTWWVNRKDADGNNVFQGGFLGLDNIGVFDRSAPLPTGGHLDQADGTAWMALYCQNMMQIAVELGADDPVYLEQAETFFEHFAWIAVAVNRSVGKAESMWDEEDGFFYDLLRLPGGGATRMRVRSMVGLLPLAAATVLPPEAVSRHPELLAGARAFIARHSSVASMVSRIRMSGDDGHHVLALFDESRLRRILARMLDEEEFLSPYGIRSLSRVHAARPFGLEVDGRRYEVPYQPAESDSGMFGGNSNWRGPVWFPVNALLIRALLNLHVAYGDDFTVECPTGSGTRMSLFEVARELSDRLTRLFLPDPGGHRPCHGGQDIFAEDEHWRDLITFSEYFHGDNGAGLGASHQTGWTGLVAVFPSLFAVLNGPDLRANGMTGVLRRSPGTEE
ncbi:MGH1-like glycoside hydrolase domain-containing protein [Jidongwangia harbinensis]|uniref:MGH1-like glycoside hydrolase domain-containing protein n=1 Tax=Jidongwangia harbinensis TaxID=2878561 RepID=UPI001CD9B0CC|nr:glucosidase [Jidongwangia harbinensis]MCA2216489.1 glucosidase [Jidongwangia harbinensis]